jgi:hypothetical protein
MKEIFKNSDGCKDIEPKDIQRLAPPIETPIFGRKTIPKSTKLTKNKKGIIFFK